jgi:repressor LexA
MEVSMAKGLTNRQKQVLDFINGFLIQNAYPPTVREVADHFGFKSPRAAHDHMRALQRKGYLTTDPRKPRTIKLAGAPPARGIPLLGRIAAGEPILAVEEADETLDLDPSFFGVGDFFALRVKGDSMIDDHIAEGDMVILRAQRQAAENQVVAVLIGDEVTLKRFHRDHGEVELRPANPKVQPIRVGPDDAELNILGVMVGLVRKM